MKLVKESVEDILKPKNLIGKKFYVRSDATGMIEFIIEIHDIHDEQLDVKVIYNNHMIEGPAIFSLEEGEFSGAKDIYFDFDDFQYYGFKELNEEAFIELDKKIKELQNFKKYLRSIL